MPAPSSVVVADPRDVAAVRDGIQALCDHAFATSETASTRDFARDLCDVAVVAAPRAPRAWWFCVSCAETHAHDERAAAHVGTARAQVGAAVAESTVYACDQYSRHVFDSALTLASATLAQKLAYHMERA